MRQLLHFEIDEPVEAVQGQGIVAIVYSKDEDWSIGLDAAAARLLAKRLLALAAEHERRFGQAVLS